MSIVAISPTIGSLGDEIGREVARARGYEFADREIIEKAAARYGEGVMELAHATEEKPTLWERFIDTSRRYMTYVEAIVLEMAAKDNVVLAGRGSAFLLGQMRHVLRVRVTAPERVRAGRLVEQQGLVPDAAAVLVRQSDNELGARVSYLYHVDWNDPLLYDLVVNTERMTVAEGAALIDRAFQNPRYQASAEAMNEIREINLTTQCRAALLAHPETRSLDLRAAFEHGQITLSGLVEHDDLKQRAEDVVTKVPGVTTVSNNIVVRRRVVATTGIIP
jgi:cytidylate kinase